MYRILGDSAAIEAGGSRTWKVNELIGIKHGVILLCPLPRESVHGHAGHCRVTNICTAACPEDFPEG